MYNDTIPEKERVFTMNDKTKKACRLFITFLKIGAFTFGGGYAMIPLIQREVVDKKGWISASDILEIIAIAESTPGPIAINAATFVGFRTCGFRGAFCATVGVILPSFITIFCISFILKEFQNARLVQQAFFGIRAAVLALIIKALWSMYKQCAKNTVSYILMAAAFVLTAFSGVNVLWVIIGCALFGLIASTIAARRGKNDIS